MEARKGGAKMKREKGCCRQCGGKVGEENLSNSKLCYGCARLNMLMWFDAMWNRWHKGRC